MYVPIPCYWLLHANARLIHTLLSLPSLPPLTPAVLLLSLKILVKELKEMVSAESFEKAAMTDEARLEVVLAGEQNLRKAADALEKLDGLKEFANSSEIQKVPALLPKLSPIQAQHLLSQVRCLNSPERYIYCAT